MFFYEKHWFGTRDTYNAYTLTNSCFPYHFHRSYEMICVADGDIQLDINDQSYTVHTGQAAIIFPNQLHQFTTLEHSSIHIIIFSPDMIPEFSRQYMDQSPDCPILSIPEGIEKEIFQTNIYLQKSFLYHMLGRLTDQSSFSTYSLSSGRQNLLHQILTYIESNYAQDCSLAGISHKLGYDYTYLSKFFYNMLGMTYTTYVNQYRITSACSLLGSTYDSISSISSKCGYDSIRSFNRNFKAICGMTPKEYRDQMLKDSPKI